MKLILLVVLYISAIAAVPPKSGIVPLREVGEGRIINGSPAEPGQFPWQVAIYFQVTGGTAFCGGSIISADWVLTAAHCAADVSSPTDFTIYAGITNLGDAANPIAVSEAIVHEDYNPNTLQNDIALLRLRDSLPLGGNINSIALSEHHLQGGTTVTVSGWGKTSDGSSTVSQSLNWVELSTINNPECSDYYGSIIGSGIVCAAAGNPAKSTCNGDSGGPLVTDPTGSPTHVAVVSFVSSLGCESGYPSGYTRTASYRNWIRQTAGV